MNPIKVLEEITKKVVREINSMKREQELSLTKISHNLLGIKKDEESIHRSFNKAKSEISLLMAHVDKLNKLKQEIEERERAAESFLKRSP